MISKNNPGLYNSKAHIPPETAFALGTQSVEKVKKQHEIDMPNANYIQLALIGARVGLVCVPLTTLTSPQHEEVKQTWDLHWVCKGFWIPTCIGNGKCMHWGPCPS